jgi:TatD DNase family protein
MAESVIRTEKRNSGFDQSSIDNRKSSILSGSGQSSIDNHQSSILSDSHCHLQMGEAGVEAMLERARAVGVTRFLIPGTTLQDSAAAVELALNHEGVLAAVGVHPHEAKDFDPARDGEALEALARRPGVAAIGEIGLDFHYDLSLREKQIEVLEWMLDLAARLGLPAVLHNRESGKEMLALLRRFPARERPGVFHSFTENAEYGKRALDLGYRISFSGMITFRAAGNIRDAAAGLPLEAMLVETDTPFLAPVPHRGKPCEPAFVVETAKKLAEVKGIGFERVSSVTTGNFEELFGRGVRP